MRRAKTTERALVRRFALTFFALVLLFSIVVHIDVEFFAGTTTRRLTRSVATVVAAAMTLGGAEVQQAGDTIVYRSSSFEVLADCTGIEVMGLFAAAVFAFPCRWAQRLTALALGIPVLVVLNLIRMITLIYFGSRSPTVLHYGHLYVWPVVLLTVALGLWLQWARKAAGDLHLLA